MNSTGTLIRSLLIMKMTLASNIRDIIIILRPRPRVLGRHISKALIWMLFRLCTPIYILNFEASLVQYLASRLAAPDYRYGVFINAFDRTNYDFRYS